jgi:hypothetical protein
MSAGNVSICEHILSPFPVILFTILRGRRVTIKILKHDFFIDLFKKKNPSRWKIEI